MIKNAKMEKSDLTLSTFVHYVKDFKFYVNVAERSQNCKEKKDYSQSVSSFKKKDEFNGGVF